MAARWSKTLKAMAKNPRGWRYDQVTALLVRHGFSLASRAGSHATWKHGSGVRVTIVDAGKGDLRPVYVEQALAALRNVGVKI